MISEFCVRSDSEEQTRTIAGTIARFFHSGDVIILDGDLGAGKTCFVKGFTEGVRARDPVNSPTFSIANFYRTDVTDILHIDLYRISTVDEFNDLGLHDYFEQSVVLIEWGKKFATSMEDYIIISLAINGDTTRTLTFTNQCDKYESVMDELKKILKGDILC